MKRKMLTVPLDPDLKAKLDTVKARGYTLNGFTRFVLAEALRDVKVPRRRRRAI